MQFTSNIICIALACCEKYTYDVRLNLHTFVHVVSEAPVAVFKECENVLKSYQNSYECGELITD